jgi:hypothetical protein
MTGAEQEVLLGEKGRRKRRALRERLREQPLREGRCWRDVAPQCRIVQVRGGAVAACLGCCVALIACRGAGNGQGAGVVVRGEPTGQQAAETTTPSQGASALVPIDAARELSLEYVREQYGSQAPERDLQWMPADDSAARMAGAIKRQFVAGAWWLSIAAPSDAPEYGAYCVVLYNNETHFRWSGGIGGDGGVSGSASTAELDAARVAMVDFFELLHDGKYAEAVLRYAGGYDLLQEWNPGISGGDRVALLRNGCQVNGLMCLNVKSVLCERQIGPDSYVFLVEFENDDGSLFVRGPCCGASEVDMPSAWQFQSRVALVDGAYRVRNLPPYVP